MSYKPATVPVKDYESSSIGHFKLILFLIVFVVGLVIGLTSSSHVDRYNHLQAEQFYGDEALAPEGNFITSSCPIVQKCEKEDCSSMDSFLMPKNLTHRMSDEELFWRASLEPVRVVYPYFRMPKVAFMFLTRGPLPFLPLWERFFEGQIEELYSIYVHALPGYELNVTNASAFYRRQIPSQV